MCFVVGETITVLPLLAPLARVGLLFVAHLLRFYGLAVLDGTMLAHILKPHARRLTDAWHMAVLVARAGVIETIGVFRPPLLAVARAVHVVGAPCQGAVAVARRYTTAPIDW